MPLLLKLLALVSFLGGPLVLLDRYAPGESKDTLAFCLVLSPCLIMVLGALSFEDDDGAYKRWVVRAGQLGAGLLTLQNAVALVLMARSHWAVQNAGMHLGGIAVGVLTAGWYVRESRRAQEPFDLQRALARMELRSLIRDYALLAIALTFVILGIVIVPRERNVGITTLAFASACLCVPVINLLRRRRLKRAQPRPLELPADRTLRPARGRIAAAMAGACLLFVVMFAFGTFFPGYMRVVLGVLAVMCAVLALLTVAGKLPPSYVRFDADALTVGRLRYAWHVPWSQLGGVLVGEYFDNPVVMLEIEDLDAVRVTPAHLRDKALRMLRRNQSFTGCPLMLMVTHYSVDAEPLAQTIERERARALGGG